MEIDRDKIVEEGRVDGADGREGGSAGGVGSPECITDVNAIEKLPLSFNSFGSGTRLDIGLGPH